MTVKQKAIKILQKEVTKLRIELASRDLAYMQRQWASKRVLEEERRLESIFNHVPDGLVVISDDRKIVFQNKWMKEKFGDCKWQTCYRAYLGNEEPCKKCIFNKYSNDASAMPIEIKSKDEKQYKIIAVPLGKFYEKNSALHLFIDVTVENRRQEELKKINKKLYDINRKLKYLTWKEPHTGLYNYRYLRSNLELEFKRAKRYFHSLGLIIIDIDYFKSINDAYGHQFGDLVLKQFGKDLKRVVRNCDSVVRFAGEEFIIICPQTDKKATLILASRILEKINSHYYGNVSNKVKIKLSIGIASYLEDLVPNGIGLLKVADMRLKWAKEKGGSAVCANGFNIKQNSFLQKNIVREEAIETTKKKICKLCERINNSITEELYAFAKVNVRRDGYGLDYLDRKSDYIEKFLNILDLDQNKGECIKKASILCDIGKIGISSKILLKKASLAEGEYMEIQKHPQISADILRPISFLHDVIPSVIYHHERWDGKGYPEGLAKQQIPLGARIIHIVNVYQALTSDRPFRKAYSKEDAISILRKLSGNEFDPELVDRFSNILEEKTLENNIIKTAKLDRKFLKEIKKQLEEKYEELNHTTHMYKSYIGGDGAVDDEDGSALDRSIDFIEKQEKREEDEMLLVKEALERITNGSFGLCLECGREIKMERLRALPYAKYCVRYKENKKKDIGK